MTKDELYPVLAREMYGEGEINDKNVKDMIKVADFLGISTIVEECELFLEKILNPENVVELYMFALDYFFSPEFYSEQFQSSKRIIKIRNLKSS